MPDRMPTDFCSYPEKRRKLVLPAKISGQSIPVAFFDADNTIRTTRSGKPSPHGKHDVRIFRETSTKLKDLINQGYILAIISNQAGIEKGYITYPEVEEAFQETLRLFAEEQVFFNYYDFAEKKDENRKPDIMMALRLEKKLKLAGLDVAWEKSFIVGDAGWKRNRDVQPDGTPGTDHSSSDRIFAANISKKHKGFAFFHPKYFFK
ncbi:MAG: hypothetical protein Kow0029_30450 [Candidatus Rifleibacteriota bacterium]